MTCTKCDKSSRWSGLCEDHYWEMVNSGKCRWVEEEEYWATQCGNAFVIIDGIPSDNEMVYYVIPLKVWIKNNLDGSKSVMVKHMKWNFPEFEYCRFNYNWAYTDNVHVHKLAVEMAKNLGASLPVEEVHELGGANND